MEPVLLLRKGQSLPILSETYRTLLADRLERLRRIHLSPKAARLWPSTRQIPSFGEMNSSHEYTLQEEIVLFGLLILTCNKRRSAVKTYRGLLEPTAQEIPTDRLVSSSDSYYIEDNGSRIQLDVTAVATQALVPGSVVALKGTFSTSDTFRVAILLYPIDTYNPTPLPSKSYFWKPTDMSRVLFISGLKLGWDAKNTARALLLSTALTSSQLSSVSQVVLCGGTYAPVEASPAAAACLGNALSPTTGFLDLQALYDLVDAVIARIAAVKPTILVPSQSDPTPRLWPQAPIPDIIIPRSILTDNITPVECPAHFLTLNGKRICIIDGTVLAYLDVLLLTENSNIQTLVTFLLRTAHLCPHAPLFFDIQPLKSDPFLLSEPLDCIVVGNCSALTSPEAYTLEYIWEEKSHLCMIFCIPEFALTRSCICWDSTECWSIFQLGEPTTEGQQ